MATRYVTLKDSNGDTIYPQSVIAQVANGEVTTGLLADGAVTTDKITDGAVTSAKIDWTTIDYSTPIQIGTWVNGKPLYRKVIDVAPLPNASSKNVSTGVSASHIVNLSGFAYQPSNNRTFMLPFLSDSPTTFITLVAQNTSVTINSYSADRSSFTMAYVYVDYWTD